MPLALELSARYLLRAALPLLHARAGRGMFPVKQSAPSGWFRGTACRPVLLSRPAGTPPRPPWQIPAPGGATA
jgi:hypothetical protein